MNFFEAKNTGEQLALKTGKVLIFVRTAQNCFQGLQSPHTLQLDLVLFWAGDHLESFTLVRFQDVFLLVTCLQKQTIIFQVKVSFHVSSSLCS